MTFGSRLLSLVLISVVALAGPALAQTFNNRAVVNTASSGDNTIIAAATGKQIYIYGFDVSTASSTTLQLKCGSTALTGAMTLNAYSKGVVNDPAYWICPANTAFIMTLGGAIQLSGTVWYKQQ